MRRALAVTAALDLVIVVIAVVAVIFIAWGEGYECVGECVGKGCVCVRERERGRH
jgi:hypothetical protein